MVMEIKRKFLCFSTKMHVSPTVYTNIWITTSEFNNQYFLQTMHLTILYNSLCQALIFCSKGTTHYAVTTVDLACH